MDTFEGEGHSLAYCRLYHLSQTVIQMKSCNLLRLTSHTQQMPLRAIQVVECVDSSFFFIENNISSYECITVSLSIYQLKNCFISTLGDCKLCCINIADSFLYEHKFSFLWSKKSRSRVARVHAVYA